VLVVSNVTAITMDSQRRVIGGASVAVDGRHIVAIGTSDEIDPRYRGAEVINGHGMVALPGLVDAHCHADQSLLRGRADDLPWIPFLADHIDPYLATRDAATTIAAYRLSMLEMIRSGTTCFVSPNVDPRDDLAALTAAVEEMGLRAVLARWTDAPRAVDGAASSVHRWDGSADGRVSMRFGLDIPRLPSDREQPELYRRVTDRARELGSGLVYHFCSEAEDSAWPEDHVGLRPAEWAQRHGILGPATLLINGCWLSAAEINVLASTSTPVTHSPSANMKMASGIAPVGALRAAGVTVALGTDGAANNNSFDMIREMKAACLLQNASNGPGTLTAEAALAMATIDGARAIGREADLGSLERGKRADLVLVDLARPHTWPVADPISNVVYAAHGGNVDTVIVDGQVLMRAGKVLVADEDRIMHDATVAAEAL